MKIAVPLAAGRLSMHFGHCDEFAIAEVDEQTREIVTTDNLQPPGYQPGVLPAWLHEQGVNVIIAGGMGQRAQQLLTQNGIKVVVGASAQTCDELITAYLDGKLQTGDNICDH